jgi:small ligand-binding sensory domain FIST
MDADALVGATVEGVIAGSFEVSHAPAVAIWALAGVEAEAVLCEPRPREEAIVAESVRARLAGPVRPEDLLILLPDSLALSPQGLLAGFERVVPGLAVIGLGASEPAGDEPRVWAGDEIATGGCAALLLRPGSAPRIGVTTGCRLVAPDWLVTRSSGRWVRGLSGRPGLEVLREIAPPWPGGAGLRGVRVAVLNGDPDVPPLLRNVVGIDEANGGFALPEPTAPGTRLAFALPDPELARRDLLDRASELVDAAPACALHLSCRTRGAALFGESGAEGALLAAALGDVPVLGLMGAYQLAPSGRSPARLHTHAGVLTVFDT